MAVLDAECENWRIITLALVGETELEGDYFLANRLIDSFFGNADTPQLLTLKDFSLYVSVIGRVLKRMPHSYLCEIRSHEINAGGPYTFDIATNLLVYNALVPFGVRLSPLEIWINSRRGRMDKITESLYEVVVHGNTKGINHLLNGFICLSKWLDLTWVNDYERPRKLEDNSKSIAQSIATNCIRNVAECDRELLHDISQGALMSEVVSFYLFVISKEVLSETPNSCLQCEYGRYIFWGVVLSTLLDWKKDKDMPLKKYSGTVVSSVIKYAYSQLLVLEPRSNDTITRAIRLHQATQNMSEEMELDIYKPIYEPLLITKPKLRGNSTDFGRYFVCRKMLDDLGDGIDSVDFTLEGVTAFLGRFSRQLASLSGYFNDYYKYQEMKYTQKNLVNEIIYFQAHIQEPPD
ncbi:MAG: hypothetical protein QY318_00565 [Candidatus Dojkabacteria bacterium]|nr:MAG: hypothetical protein QY318_00565 [Candidatus Dojkabacteria bacterium]